MLIGTRRSPPDETSWEVQASQDAGEEVLKSRILDLSDRISSLVENPGRPIEDISLAQEIAQRVKPHLDRLFALQRLLNPVDRIVQKRDQIHQLQAAIAEDVVEVENLSDDMVSTVEASLLNDLEGEIDAVKRDRKLFVSEIHGEEAEPAFQPPLRSGGQALLELSAPERFSRLLGDRFISLPRLAEILGSSFSEGFIATHHALLDQVWATVFETEALRPHIQQNRLKTLQKAFSDYALLFRSPQWETGSPCSLENLRHRFHPFFVNAKERGLWYTHLDFYHQTFSRPHWALVDRQYLNCTFKKPSIRLLMYARANELSPRIVRQKSVLEDVYDRIVLQLALKEPFFASCNSITSTTYQQGRNSPVKQVYVYTRDDNIRISGKCGTPHWRLTRPCWPGVLPNLIFPAG